MGKLQKRSKSKSASKRPRPFLLQGSLGQAKVVDKSFGSSRTSFRSAISRLKDDDFDDADNSSYSDDDAAAIADVMLLESASQPSTVAGFHPDAGFASAGIDLAGSNAAAALISGASSAPSTMVCATHALAAENALLGADVGSCKYVFPSPKELLDSDGILPTPSHAVAAAVYPLDFMQFPSKAPLNLLVSSQVKNEANHLLVGSSAGRVADAMSPPGASAASADTADPSADPLMMEFVPLPLAAVNGLPPLTSDGILPFPTPAFVADKQVDIAQISANAPLYPLVSSHVSQKCTSNSNSVCPTSDKSCLAKLPLLPSPPFLFGDFLSPSFGDTCSCTSVHPSPAQVKDAHASSSEGCSLLHHKVNPLKEHEILPIPSKISQQGVIAWSLSLVGFFVGGKKSIHFATFWANKIWGSRIAKVYFKGNGLYIFNFKNEDDMLRILNSGPIFFGKSLMILQRWQPGMDLIKADPSSIPIWINFHNVPLALWHTDGFAFLASHFRKPLYLDELTLKGNKLAFARVCVDIEATTTVPSSLRIQIENCAPHEIRVEIPWQPNKCLHCKTYGHSTSSCPSLPRHKEMDLNRSKRKSVWKEVEINKEDNPPTSPISPAPAALGSFHGKGKENTSPDSIIPRHTPASQNIQKSAPESSARKRVHFDRVELLIDKVNLAKQDALSTISFPALKSCLKFPQSGRFPTRLAEFKPPLKI